MPKLKCFFNFFLPKYFHQVFCAEREECRLLSSDQKLLNQKDKICRSDQNKMFFKFSSRKRQVLNEDASRFIEFFLQYFHSPTKG